MKIILVRYHDKGNINTRLPDSLNKRQGYVPPLGLAYIAAMLKKNNYDVKILDVPALNLSSFDVKKYFQNTCPDIIGISCMTTNFPGALECAKIAKSVNAITVLGGPQMDILPIEMLSYEFIDYGISGEGEYSFLTLVKLLDSNNSFEKSEKIKNIPGIIFRSGNKIIRNESELIENLDEIPFPERKLLPNDKYSSIIGRNPITTMITTRGCPYNCGFCFKGPQDKKFLLRSAENVVDEMEQVILDFKVKEIMFYDDVITLKKEHIVSICEEIIKRNIKICWESPTRIDIVNRELLKLMRRAGCIRLRYGVESGNKEILRKMNKKIELQKVQEVFKMTEEEGIERFAYFIIGYLGENDQTMQETIDFAKKLNPDLVMFTLATPLPATPLFEDTVKAGIIDKNYWRDFTLGKRNDRIPILTANAEEYIKKAYKEFYLRPGYIIKNILKIRNLDTIKRYYNAFLGIMNFRMKSKN